MGHTMMVRRALHGTYNDMMVRRALQGTYNDGGEEGVAWDVQ